MAFKPMFALHKTKSGNVLAANSFTQNYQLSAWLRDLDVRAGDRIEFNEVAERPEFDEVEPDESPALETPPYAPERISEEQF